MSAEKDQGREQAWERRLARQGRGDKGAAYGQDHGRIEDGRRTREFDAEANDGVDHEAHESRQDQRYAQRPDSGSLGELGLDQQTGAAGYGGDIDQYGGIYSGQGGPETDNVANAEDATEPSEAEYLAWRKAHMQALDDEYRAFRAHRQKSFSSEFEAYRKNRATSAGPDSFNATKAE